MRCLRYVRAALYALVFAAVLTLVLVAGITLYATPNRVGAKLAASIEASLGWRLTNPIPADLKRFPKLVAVLPAGDILGPQGVRIAHYEGLTIEMNPFAAFAQIPRIDALMLDAPEGILDLDSLRAVLSAQAQGSAAEQAPLWDGMKQLAAESGREPHEAAALWTIRSAKLHNARLVIEGLPSDARLSLSGLDAAIENLTDSSALLRLACAYEARSGSGDMTLAANLAWDREGSLRASRATFTAKGFWRGQAVELNGDGDDLLWQPDQFAASRLVARAALSGGAIFALQAEDLMRSPNEQRAQLSAELSAPQRGRTASLKGQARLRHQGADQHWLLENIVLRSAEQGSEQESLLTGKVLADSTFEHGVINLSGALLSAPLTLDAQFSYAEMRPLLTGVLRIGDLDAAIGSLLLPNRALLHAVDFSGRAELSGFTFAPTIDKLSGVMELKDGSLRFFAPDAELFSGRGAVTADMAPNGQWSAQIKLADADAQTVAKNWLRLPAVSGRASLLLSAAGALSEHAGSTKFGLQALNGVMRIEDGELLGIDAAAARDALLAERAGEPPAESLLSSARTPFLSLDARLAFDAEADGMRITQGVLVGDGWHGRIEGAAAKSGLRTDVAFLFSQSLAAEGDAAQAAPKPLLPMTAHLSNAPDAEPLWTWRWTEALEAAERQFGPSPLSAENILKRLRRSLRNFWTNLRFSTEWPSLDFSMPDWHLPERFGGPTAPKPGEAL